MTIKILYAILFFISLIHVFEEYFTGWIDYARLYQPGIKKIEFIIVNIIFLILVLISVLLVYNNYSGLFNLAVIFLIFINSLIHIIPTIIKRKYLPGFLSALFGYMPFSICIFILHYMTDHIPVNRIIYSFITGLLMMSLPFIYQIILKKLLRKK